MIIEAEIYGMIPSAKIDPREKAPPTNALRRPRIPIPCVLANSSDNICESIPGNIIKDTAR
jgi:hypothetical protein